MRMPATQGEGERLSRDRWVALDFSQDPIPTIDFVPRVITPGWITLFSGAPGSGKSYAYQALVAAAMTGDSWLGMPVNGIERVLVVDEENPSDTVIQRLRAFGVGAEHAARIRYYSQIGCRLGAPTDSSWGDELLAIVGEYRPQLVVVDSASSATATALNENDSISATFSTVLRPLARLGCAVVLIAHDRKSGGEVAERVLGGVQWLGQIDRQIAFEARSRRADAWTTADGTERVSFPIRLVAGKGRQGIGIPDTNASIESDQDQQGAYRWVRLDTGESAPNVSRELSEGIIAVLRGREDGRARLAEIATSVDLAANDGRLVRALESMLRRGEIVKPARGIYALG